MATTFNPDCTMENHGKANPTAECCIPETNPAPSFWGDRAAWSKATKNTFNCLVGCSIGDFGTIIFLQLYYPETSLWLMMTLAMTMGLISSIVLETVILKIREHFSWNGAVKMAFSMSFISMLGMEFSANVTDYFLTGGAIPISDPRYWAAIGVSMAAGFLAPLPYNYFRFKKHGQSCH